MAKGYWIAHVDVADPEAYRPIARQRDPFAKYGARFLVRAGSRARRAPALPPRRHRVQDYDALACTNREYARAACASRLASRRVIVEGYDGRSRLIGRGRNGRHAAHRDGAAGRMGGCCQDDRGDA